MSDGSTGTVLYDRWYVAETAWRGRPRHAAWPRRTAIDKREPDPRVALAIAAQTRGQSLAALSRMIDRPARYLDRFVRDGSPRALTAAEHETLAAFFGVDERALGVRDLWVPM